MSIRSRLKLAEISIDYLESMNKTLLTYDTRTSSRVCELAGEVRGLTHNLEGHCENTDDSSKRIKCLEGKVEAMLKLMDIRQESNNNGIRDANKHIDAIAEHLEIHLVNCNDIKAVEKE